MMLMEMYNQVKDVVTFICSTAEVNLQTLEEAVMFSSVTYYEVLMCCIRLVMRQAALTIVGSTNLYKMFMVVGLAHPRMPRWTLIKFCEERFSLFYIP